jgi:glycosyltransferase involved in cell wall biosynthesis
VPVFLSIVIPAHREQHRLIPTLRAVCAYLQQQPYVSEVLVVENDDRDSASAATGCELGRVRWLRESRRGKGLAVRRGVLESVGQYRFICDADLSMPIEQVPNFLPPHLENFDIAIGSREAVGARRVGDPVLRQLMSRAFSRLVRMTVLPQFADTQCGFKCFRSEVAVDLFTVQRLGGFSFDVEILYIALKRGYRIVEVPIEWQYCPESRVRLLADSFGMIRDLLRIRQNWAEGKYARQDGS